MIEPSRMSIHLSVISTFRFAQQRLRTTMIEFLFPPRTSVIQYISFYKNAFFLELTFYIVFYIYIYIFFLSNQTMRVESKRRTFCLIKNNKLLVFTRLGYIRAGMEIQLKQVSSSTSFKFVNQEDITVPRDPMVGGGE